MPLRLIRPRSPRLCDQPEQLRGEYEDVHGTRPGAVAGPASGRRAWRGALYCARGVGRPGAAWGSVPVTRRTRMPWARCVLKRQVQLAVRGVGFVVVRFVEPQHVWDLGIGAVGHERITIGAGDGREGNRFTDRGCGQPRCDVVQFDPHGGTPSWKLNPDSLSTVIWESGCADRVSPVGGQEL